MKKYLLFYLVSFNMAFATEEGRPNTKEKKHKVDIVCDPETGDMYFEPKDGPSDSDKKEIVEEYIRQNRYNDNQLLIEMSLNSDIGRYSDLLPTIIGYIEFKEFKADHDLKNKKRSKLIEEAAKGALIDILSNPSKLKELDNLIINKVREKLIKYKNLLGIYNQKKIQGDASAARLRAISDYLIETLKAQNKLHF